MDFHAEVEKRKNRHGAALADLAYEAYRLTKDIARAQVRLTELSDAIATHESAIAECNKAQKDFNTYLAIKEAAVTLEDIQKGVEDAAEGTN